MIVDGFRIPRTRSSIVIPSEINIDAEHVSSCNDEDINIAGGKVHTVRYRSSHDPERRSVEISEMAGNEKYTRVHLDSVLAHR